MVVARLRQRLGRRFGRNLEASVGGVLCVIGGLITLAGMAAPHEAAPDVVAYIWLSVGLVVAGVLLLTMSERLTAKAPPLMLALAIFACAYGVYFNGERAGGSPMFNEVFFFFWPALYAGYFFKPRAIAVACAGIALSYGAVLSTLGQPMEALAPRFNIVVASMVGTAIVARILRAHVDRLVARLNRLARTDVLTGLLNRRAFDEALKHELQRTARTNEPFALLLGDIDHFKDLNDAHGHEAGDQALTWVAEALGRDSRSIDTVARIGGEEFAVLLPGAAREDGIKRAERLRHAVTTQTGTAELTMSFGVVEAPLHGTDADDLLRRADRALYAAKDAGRDRVAAAPEPLAI
jgi:diguanylate cyclase (GGDEF)-like protein